LRILSRKTWRAFPELDRFDDDTCNRLIQRVWNQRGSWSLGVLILISVPVSLVLWFVIMIVTALVFELSVFPTMSEVLVLMQRGFIGGPLIAGFIVRDLWVSKQIRKHIDGVICKECEYSLLGLEINKSSVNAYVLCPECGVKNEFIDGELAEADIKPALLSEPNA
jgi:hypothetical protein